MSSKGKSNKTPKPAPSSPQPASPPPNSASNRVERERAQFAHAERIRKIDAFVQVVRTLIKAGCVVAIAYFVSACVASLAGKSTTVVAIAKALVDLRANEYFAWTVATLASGGYWYERRLRKKTIKELGEYPRKLEKAVDDRRSGSRLGPGGDPSKEDRDG